MSDSDDFKMDSMDEEEPEELSFGPAALGLHRVGTLPPKKPQPKRPIQTLNARGMPARIRKKNRLFFDDEHVTERPPKTPKKMAPKSPVKPPKELPKPSPQKQRKALNPTKLTKSKVDEVRVSKQNHRLSKAKQESPKAASSLSPSSAEVTQDDRLIAAGISARLRNILKLPRAHKWVYYEFFYSSIDECLFGGETEFQLCLREHYPQLRTRDLVRREWTKIRRTFGKPRRCSQAFLEEERTILHRKRNKIRTLQSRRITDQSFVRDMPKQIPMSLPVGTRIVGRLRTPQDGMFNGVIDAVDFVNATYRVTFDRERGSFTLPDYEVSSISYKEMIAVSAVTHDFRPRSNIPCYASSSLQRGNFLNSINRKDPLLGSESLSSTRFKNISLPRDSIGGFPIKILELIVRLRKTLRAKTQKMELLRDLNTEAENLKSRYIVYPDEYQRRYAAVVICIEKINRDMQQYLNQVTECSREIIKDSCTAAMLEPTLLRERSREQARDAVDRNNDGAITHPTMLQIINDLSMIMWVVSQMYNGEPYSHVMRVLEGCMEESKNRINPNNVFAFQKNVQVHMRHIQLGLSQQANTN